MAMLHDTGEGCVRCCLQIELVQLRSNTSPQHVMGRARELFPAYRTSLHQIDE